MVLVHIKELCFPLGCGVVVFRILSCKALLGLCHEKTNVKRVGCLDKGISGFAESAVDEGLKVIISAARLAHCRHSNPYILRARGKTTTNVDITTGNAPYTIASEL